ncbi:MAG: ABC transporter permease [Phycisphaerae bacterium]|nr:ABC transporter permease [Phycisphaerae bacterium]
MNPVVWLESFRIAVRQMRRHRTRSILTMLGVIIGVAAIISVIAISEGAKQRIQGQIANLGTNMIIVLAGSTSQGGVRAGAGSAETLTVQDAEAIERECSAVGHASAVTRSICQAVGELANWSVRVTGAEADYLRVRSWSVDVGREIEQRDVDSAAKVCLIGRTSAQQLFGKSDPVGQRIRVKGTPMEIVGLLAEKGQSPLGEDQDDILIVPITTAFRHLTGGDRPKAIVLSAVSESQIDQAMNQVQTLLRHRHQLRGDEMDDFTVKSISEAAQTAERTSNVMTLLLVSIAGISLLVGGIGIMNIMLVTVMERTREIGIRMALGADRRMIMRQFMLEAGALAGAGGLLGVVVGLIGCVLIARLTGLMPVLSPMLLAGPLVFAVCIGLVFGLLPARRASRLNPVESLRHD